VSRPRRRWRDKFAEAANGVRLAVAEGSSFAVHLPAATLVFVSAGLLGCGWVEWCLLVGCVGAVLAAETFNAALETLFHALDDGAKSRMTACLDRAAGAVLLTSGTAAVVGTIVLGRRLLM
jgi:diacylglycerol kinase